MTTKDRVSVLRSVPIGCTASWLSEYCSCPAHRAIQRAEAAAEDRRYYASLEQRHERALDVLAGREEAA